MEAVIRADIFFFISSISAIVLTIALVVAIYYFVVVLREVRKLVQSIQTEVDRFKKRRRDLAVHMQAFGKLARGIARRLFRNDRM